MNRRRTVWIVLCQWLVLSFATSGCGPILLYRAFDSRKLPDLQPWHKAPARADDPTAGSYATFAHYLAAERKFLDDIYASVSSDTSAGAGTAFNRYVRDSPSSPYGAASPYPDRNGNSSFELPPANPPARAGLLLVHGLTDSPYHVRAVAQIFAARGYYVIGLRLPGHGTTPGALTKVAWEDWYGATEFGVRMLRGELERVGVTRFAVGGFSTGGALTLRYTLTAAQATDQRRLPSAVFLFSPAIGVSFFAEFAGLHRTLSWMPYFAKFAWLSIEPEYDPFKYDSFPKNGGYQVRRLTDANNDSIAACHAADECRRRIPPIYAFQSVVDDTVITGKLVEMYTQIGTDRSELVLFDVNHRYEQFMKADVTMHQWAGVADLPGMQSRVLLVTNRPSPEGKAEPTPRVYRLARGAPGAPAALEPQLDMPVEPWPEYAYALSHVCIPISPDDKAYGAKAPLGGLNVKGENNVLLMSSASFARIRYNPFFAVVRQRIERALAELQP